MGFVFTLLYIVAAYVGPETIYGTLADYHLGVIVALLAMLCSVVNISRSGVGKMLQSKALGGLCLVVVASIFINVSKLRAPEVLMDFVPVIAGFFLVVLNCRTKRRLQILIACIFFVCVFYIVQASRALRLGDDESPYLLVQNLVAGGSVMRIRGLDFLSDPNDFAQLMVALIPCTFFFWTKGKKFLNLLLVYVPVGLLVYGMYLTHSRGGMLSLMVITVVAGRKKIGVVPAVVGAAIMFIGLSAVGFTGGRDVTDGEDRIELWSNGLTLFKTDPIFGIGFNQFTDRSDSGLTAHNTFVVCTTELGLLGSWCWLLVLVVTLRNSFMESNDPNKVRKEVRAGPEHLHMGVAFGSEAAGVAHLAMPGQMKATEPAFASGSMFPTPKSFVVEATQALDDRPMPGLRGAVDDKKKEISDEEIRRLSGLMLVSLAGFLTAAWFLSRAFAMDLYVYVGIAAAVHQMAVERGIAAPALAPKQASKYAAYACVGLMTFVYLNIRIMH